MESELPDTSIISEAQSKSFYFLHKLKNGSFVSHSLVANLRSPQQQDLLFVKGNMLEILSLNDSKESLVSVVEQTLFSFIKDIKIIKRNGDIDMILILSEIGIVELFEFNEATDVFVLKSSSSYLFYQPSSLLFQTQQECRPQIISVFQEKCNDYFFCFVGVAALADYFWILQIENSFENMNQLVCYKFPKSNTIIWSIIFLNNSSRSFLDIVEMALLIHEPNTLDSRQIIFFTFDSINLKITPLITITEYGNPISLSSNSFLPIFFAIKNSEVSLISRKEDLFHSKTIRLGKQENFYFSCWTWGLDENSLPTLYLLNEFGQLYSIKIKSESSYEIYNYEEKIHPANTISYLDSNFLILSGQFCNGSMILLSNNKWKKVLSIVDWSPIVDCQLIQSPTLGSLFVSCSGNAIYRFNFGCGINNISSQDFFQGANGIWSLYSSENSEYHSYLVISFLSQTRVYERIGSTLEDRSATFGFKTHQSTLFASSLANDCLVQVLNSVIHITHTIGIIQEFWTPNNGQTINLATTYLNQIILILSKPNIILVLNVNKLSNEKIEIIETYKLEIDFEPSCLYLLELQEPILVVGTYQSQIQFFPIHSNLTELIPKPINLESLSKKTSIPNSINCIILKKQNIGFLIIALRDGSILFFDFVPDQIQFSESPKYIHTLGVIPASLVKIQEGILILSDYPWKLKLHEEGSIQLLSLETFRSISCGCAFKFPDVPDALVFISEDKLVIFTTKESIQLVPTCITRFEERPRRLAFDPISGSLIVGGSQNSDHSVLVLVDILSGNYLSSLSLENQIIHSLQIWEIGVKANYVCLGTGLMETKGMILNGGQLFIYQIGGNYSLHQILEVPFSDPVYSICPRDNQTLMIGTGTELKVFSLVGVARNKLQIIAQISLDSRIISLSSSALGSALILAGTQTSLVFLLLEYLENRFQIKNLSATNQLLHIPNSLSDAVLISEEEALVGDKYGNLFSLKRNFDSKQMEEGLSYGISIGVGESISKVKISNSKPRTLLCISVLGSIFILIPLQNSAQYHLLDKFQTIMTKYMIKNKKSPTLDFPLSTIHQEAFFPVQSVVNGIFLSTFPSLDSKEKEEILQLWGKFIQQHHQNEEIIPIQQILQNIYNQVTSF